MDASIKSAPNYGRRVIPNLIYEIAQNEPDKEFLSLAKTTNPSDGFTSFTYGMLSRAVDAYSWWLIDRLGRNEEEQEPICTGLMPQDVRHIVLAVACVKTGYVVRLYKARSCVKSADNGALRRRCFLHPLR